MKTDYNLDKYKCYPTIANKYKVLKQLNNGVFGTIYKCENIRTKELVAIKMELADSLVKSLKNEARIYQYLSTISGIPRLKWFGKFDDYTYLVMDLLGLSITEFKCKHYYEIRLEQVLNIGIQMINIIKLVHEKDLLHRDIKPDNFMFDLNESTNKIYLIDFGLAKRYRYDCKHISENTISSLIGTPTFVSLNIHNGCEPSRRDDIESCIYVLLYMLWSDFYWVNLNIDQIIQEKKDIFNTSSCVPMFIRNMLLYVRNMTFEEEPDYPFLINVLKYELKYNNDNKH